MGVVARIFIVLAVAAALLLAVPGPAVAQSDDPSSFDYGLIIDAGSSHSGIYIYKWDSRIGTTTSSSSSSTPIPPFSQPVTQQAWSADNKKAISKFNTNPTQAGASLQPLIAFATGIFTGLGITSQQKLSTIPIFLGATAGMRELDLNTREAILTSIRQYLADPATSPFQFQSEWARVISGEEEGVFGWLTVNYAAGKFGTAPPPPSLSSASNGKRKLELNAKGGGGGGAATDPTSYYGALDMGGASTQITFSPPNNDILADYFNIRGIPPGNAINLYTHSYLYFGLNDATSRVNDLIASNTSASARTNDQSQAYYHPCLNTGYTQYFYTTKDGSNRVVNFTGTSDPVKCLALARSLLNLDAVCWTPNSCAVSGVYQPPLVSGMTYIGFSAYGTVFNSSNLGPATTLQQLVDTQMSLCGLNYAQLVHEYSSPYASTLCFGLSYYKELLISGYGFSPVATPTTGPMFQVLQQMNGYDLGWALGGMLYQANAMGWNLPSMSGGGGDDADNKAHTDTIVVGVVLSVLLLCVTTALVVVYFRYQSLMQRVGISDGSEHI